MTVHLTAVSTNNPIYPYVLFVGDHEPVPVPMTAGKLRALRDNLSALLAGPAPAPADDFVTEWASMHGALVRDTPTSPHPVDTADTGDTAVTPVPAIFAGAVRLPERAPARLHTAA
jgi:hypothetical protein